MANTWQIVCHDCRKAYWFGQSRYGLDAEGFYIYTTPEDIESLTRFLYEHRNCKHLQIVDEFATNKDVYDYEEQRWRSSDD